ncbi:hypothetical protein PQX77_003038, partial [Marasmius sp. AFHP31]
LAYQLVLVDLAIVRNFCGLNDPRGTGFWVAMDDVDDTTRTLHISKCPDMYKMRAYQWLTLLRVLPSDLVMTTVYDHNIVRLDRDYNLDDVERALDTFSPNPTPLL